MTSLAARIDRYLSKQLGLAVDIEETDEAIVLRGRVDSVQTRLAARRTAAELAGSKRVEDHLVIEPSVLEAPAEPLETVSFERGLEAESGSAEDEQESFPPTDPVITIDAHGRPEVLGGFAETSMTSLEVEPSAEDNLPGDEALADAIRRELREDAATTDLQIHVVVRRGVVHLRGRVPTLQDAENAEEVAARLPEVREVAEELEVAGP